jgi:hypothetical protein
MSSDSHDSHEIDPISDHSVPADADFSAAGSDEAGPPASGEPAEDEAVGDEPESVEGRTED